MGSRLRVNLSFGDFTYLGDKFSDFHPQAKSSYGLKKTKKLTRDEKFAVRTEDFFEITLKFGESRGFSD